MIYTNLGPLSPANLALLGDFGIAVEPLPVAALAHQRVPPSGRSLPQEGVSARRLLDRLDLPDVFLAKAERLLRLNLPVAYVTRRLLEAAATGNTD